MCLPPVFSHGSEMCTGAPYMDSEEFSPVGPFCGEQPYNQEETLQLTSPEGMMRWVGTHGKPKQEGNGTLQGGIPKGNERKKKKETIKRPFWYFKQYRTS
jgi:hypothetical protein